MLLPVPGIAAGRLRQVHRELVIAAVTQMTAHPDDRRVADAACRSKSGNIHFTDKLRILQDIVGDLFFRGGELLIVLPDMFNCGGTVSHKNSFLRSMPAAGPSAGPVQAFC